MFHALFLQVQARALASNRERCHTADFPRHFIDYIQNDDESETLAAFRLRVLIERPDIRDQEVTPIGKGSRRLNLIKG